MVEKTELKVEVGETAQPAGTEAQPTVEELQRQAEEKDQEIERKEGVIKQLKTAIKGGGSRAEIEALGVKIDSQQDWFAGALDDLAGRVSGEDLEKPVRKSYTQSLKDSRAQIQPSKDPEADKFFEYLASEELDLYDDLVQEAIKDTNSPQQALKSVKDKVKTKSQTEIEKLAEKKAEEKINTALEQKLKDMGLTTGGAGSPSGGGRTFTRKQISDMSVEEYKEKRVEISEAQRQGKIRD